MAEKEPVVIDEVVTLDMDDNDFKVNTVMDIIWNSMPNVIPV
jgi:hypothetical protein